MGRHCRCWFGLLAALLFCLSAQKVPALGPTTAPGDTAVQPGEAESFWRSILAAQDAATLQSYLSCFSEQRQQALWEQLDDAQQRSVQMTLERLGVRAAFAGQQTSGAQDWELCSEAGWEEDGYTLRLEAWTTADRDAVLEYRFSGALDTSQAHVQIWSVDKTHAGWSQVKKNVPDVCTTLQEGVLTVSGFDFSAARVSETPRLGEEGRTEYGSKLVIRVTGLRESEDTFGGQGAEMGQGGVLSGREDGTFAAEFPSAAVDLPLRCRYTPRTQTLQPGQTVNFGYMLNPPDGGVGQRPDGQNNACCTVIYTVEDTAGHPVGVFTVPAGAVMTAGQWTTPLPADLPAPTSDTRYTVTVTLRSDNPASGVGTGVCRELTRQTSAAVQVAAA